MENETVERHRCDEVTSTPQSKLTLQQSAVPIEKSSSCGQATKRLRTTLMKQTEKGLVNRKSGGHGAHSQAWDRLRFAVHKVAHFSVTDVFASGYVVSARDSALLPIDSRLPVSLPTLHFTVSLVQPVSRQPEGPQSSRRGKKHANNRVVTRILMTVV